MERKEAMLKTGCSRILWAVMAILLCAQAFGAVPLPIPELGTLNVGTGPLPPVHMEQILSIDWASVDVLGTLNMYAGAYIEPWIYAFPGSTVNIYAGEIVAGSPIVVFDGSTVTVYGTDFGGDGDFSVLGQVSFSTGSGILTVTYTDENGDPIGDPVDLLFYSDIAINLVNTAVGGPTEITIDIKPGSTPNAINLGSNGVIPVAILSTPDFDATTAINPENVFLAGSGVAVRGKGNKLLSSNEDVNGDSLLDLVIKVETENLDPGTFQNGSATLQVIVDSIVIYQGSDSITIVPPPEE